MTTTAGMLDLNIFSAEKGFDSRSSVPSFRQCQDQFELEILRKDFNRINKEVASLKTEEKEDATEMINSTNGNKKLTTEMEIEVQ
ncbi:serine--tRNA ligase-like isoform X1 [Dioscorea cayenensis subsp. rotundata]|uniref:Serine--tRNA ligase-like isoform X1 n=1 Tax=Dioscorea cayennensis subsp. rotundata TaxID=55577 RepID=A0AB40ASV0_DIOCR|nr:serine--tRNA ligase-like isoform X1 [Dioscorea cayenensis subsp. rotundata]